MPGYPLRPSRDDFGPDPENAAPVRDARRQISAEIFRLAFHQIAGSGLLMPRVMLAFNAQVGPTIVGRAEAWNPKGLNTGQFADPAITRTGAGNYLVEYPTPVVDEMAVDQPISFVWAMACVINDDPTVMKHALAAVVTTDTNQLRVCAFSATHVLEDNNRVLLLGW